MTQIGREANGTFAKGNHLGGPLKFDTPEKRQNLFKGFIEHVRQGFSLNSFGPCSHLTIKYYIKNFPADCSLNLLQEAIREGHALLEKVGHSGMRGKIPGYNDRSWQFIMKNKYPTEYKDKTEHKVETTISLSSEIEKARKRIEHKTITVVTEDD